MQTEYDEQVPVVGLLVPLSYSTEASEFIVMYDEVALTCVIPSLLSIGPRTQNSAVPVETFYVWGLFVPLPTVASEFNHPVRLLHPTATPPHTQQYYRNE